MKQRAVRRRVLKAGTISFNSAAGIECTIRNLSGTGACLQVESVVGIPDSFTLVIATERSHRACRVVWRKSNRIGIEFDSRADENESGGSLVALLD